MGLALTEAKRKLRLMSIETAAEYVGVSRTTVRRWISEGGLRTFRAGRQHRIDEGDLIAFMTPEPTPEPGKE